MNHDLCRLWAGLAALGIGISIGAVLYLHAPVMSLLSYPVYFLSWWITRKR